MKVLILITFLLASLSNIYSNVQDSVWFRWHSDIYDVQFTPDGDKILLSSHYDFRIVKTQDGSIEKTIPDTKRGKISPDGKYFVFQGHKNPFVLDAKTFEKIDHLEEDDLGTQYTNVSENGLMVACTESTPIERIRVWDLESGRIIYTRNYSQTRPENEGIEVVGQTLITPDGKKLIARCASLSESDNRGDRDIIRKYTQVINIENDSLLYEIENSSYMYMSKTGKYFAVKGWYDQRSYALRVFDIETGEIFYDLPGYQDAINNIDFYENDKYLAFAQYSTIWIIDLQTGEHIYTYQTQNHHKCAFSKDFVVAGGGAGLYLFRLPWLENSVEEPTHSFSISPNPATDFINIETESLTEEIEIYNMLGIPVLKAIGNGRIDVSGLPRGMYIIKIDNKTYTKLILH